MRELESNSLTSPLVASGGGVGVCRIGPFKDALRPGAPFKDEDTRGDVTAERAVAPFVIEFGGELAGEAGVRRELGGVARPVRGEVVVAISRYKVVPYRINRELGGGWAVQGQRSFRFACPVVQSRQE